MASASDVQSQGVAVDGPSTASHGRIGSIAVNRIGLSEVYSPPEGTNVAAQYCFTALCKHDPQLTPASIVFIHGLFGYPHDTWYVKQPKAKDRLKFPGYVFQHCLRVLLSSSIVMASGAQANCMFKLEEKHTRGHASRCNRKSWESWSVLATGSVATSNT